MNYFARFKFLLFCIAFAILTVFASAQKKNADNKYAPRMEEFDNIDRDINLSSVESGVKNSFEEIFNQFNELKKALIEAGIDDSDIRKLLSAITSELNEQKAATEVPQKTQKTTTQNNKKQQESKATRKAKKVTENKTATAKKTSNDDSSLRKAINIRKQFVEYSLSLRGIPYKLGSASPENGLDCSGFVQYSVKNSIHRKMPRTANEMYTAMERAGKLVSDQEREPGDLVFFKENPFGNITHVGIYLGKYRGSGRLQGREIFVNSASAGPRTGVVISALDEPYWKRTYYKSGRFLPQTKNVVRQAKRQKKA